MSAAFFLLACLSTDLLLMFPKHLVRHATPTRLSLGAAQKAGQTRGSQEGRIASATALESVCCMRRPELSCPPVPVLRREMQPLRYASALRQRPLAFGEGRAMETSERPP
jgi:hypothetical protein